MLALALIASATLASTDIVVIKLATLAPQGSPYELVLKDMGRKWFDASGGRVRLRIYAGGVAGGEGDMVRKIGVGQLQAASVTTVGLHDITSEPAVLDAPGLIRSAAELDAVLPVIQGRLEQALSDKGFVAVGWANVGVARFFSASPLRRPSEARNSKLYSWEGDPNSVAGWEAAGFRPVVLSSADITPSLATGMIDSLCEPPLFAFVARTFDRTRHMLDFDWSLLSAATIVQKQTWERIPLDVRRKLLVIGAESGRELSARAKRMNDEAVDEMQRQGLIIDEPTDPAEWQAAAERTWPIIREREVPSDLFDEVQRLALAARARPR
ncbi:MAG: TRAP transporter substrate-binding protein DctP [Deltaproteobacteria bacterium]